MSQTTFPPLHVQPAQGIAKVRLVEARSIEGLLADLDRLAARNRAESEAEEDSNFRKGHAAGLADGYALAAKWLRRHVLRESSPYRNGSPCFPCPNCQAGGELPLCEACAAELDEREEVPG